MRSAIELGLAAAALLALAVWPPLARGQPNPDSIAEARSAPLGAGDVAFALRYGRTPPADPTPDEWLARDKGKHVVFSSLWTLSTQYVLVEKADWSSDDALLGSLASGAAAGLAKEAYDARSPGGRASWKDLAADAVGLGLAAGIIAL